VELEKSSVIEYVSPEKLKPHPINEAIYGTDGYKDLIESIKEIGVQQAIYATEDNLIISGHRRWRAALEAGVTIIPLIRVRYAHELELRRAIIEHNRYRVKNGQQLYNEGKELEKIEVERAKERHEATRFGAVVQKFAPPEEKGKSRDKVAATIGLGSGFQWDKLDFVAEHKPELLKEIRISRSLDSAFNEVRRENKKHDIENYESQELEGKYNVFYADPPWIFENNSSSLRNVADNEYPTMTYDELLKLEITPHVLDDAVLFLWSPSAMIHKALHVIEAWGFEFKTSMVWIKNRIGTGFFIRGRHEFLLIATKGSFLPMTSKIPESVITANIEAHSKKPSVVYGLIERMYPSQLYCELFAREKHSEQWYAWGNEINSNVR